jgi:two-component system, chemotaxis family, response regulator Rcp1
MTDRPLRKKILLAEDNLADYELTKLAFEEFNFPVDIIHLGDGQELLNFFSTNPISDIELMLLDLNMPKVSGIEILKMMYDDPVLRRLPVIVLSSSLHNNDVQACYEYGANAYVNKPIDINEFNKLIRAIANFWIGINQGPVYESKSVS